MHVTLGSELSAVCRTMQAGSITFHEAVRFFKREWISQALENSCGNKCRAARGTGLHRNTVGRLVRELDIDTRRP
jgi:transcriptional regulator with GAF, ATPase, and Fis domain